MIYKNGVLIQESVAKIPLSASDTASLAIGANGSAVIDVPEGEVWFIKSWTITKGADVTVDSILINGNDTGHVDTLADTVAEYGDLLTAQGTITVNGTNAGAAAENIQIDVKGYKMR